MIGRGDYFNWIHFHNFIFTFYYSLFLCPISFICSHTQVLGMILVYEFHIFCGYTDWYFIHLLSWDALFLLDR